MMEKLRREKRRKEDQKCPRRVRNLEKMKERNFFLKSEFPLIPINHIMY